MQGNIEAYRIWAPDDALWAQWAKPVLFADMPQKVNEKLHIPSLDWIAAADYSTAIIVDLPEHEGVLEGLALARIGYRPVPLYNGVCGPSLSSMIVPVKNIVHALCIGSDELTKMAIRPDAPPAFLLDSNRMSGFGKQAGKYDNRWCVFPQDMPSAAYLMNKGIRNVLVRTNSSHDDLRHILYRYEKQGITVLLCNGGTPKRVEVTKPSKFKSVIYRFSVIMGLTRNAAGGFGGQIPDATDRGYGIG